jgi:hypothetical protein
MKRHLDIARRSGDHSQNSIAQLPWPRDRNHGCTWKICTDGVQEHLSAGFMQIEVAEDDLMAPPP